MATVEPKVFKTSRKQRIGRGFSREELRKADSSPKEALRFGIRTDSKRKTIHEENVEALKAYLKDKKAAARAKVAAKPKTVAAKPEVAAKSKVTVKPKAAAKPKAGTKSRVAGKTERKTKS